MMVQNSMREGSPEIVPTMTYNLIYIFGIDDGLHKGCLNIGETILRSSKTYRQFRSFSPELSEAAWVKIDQYIDQHRDVLGGSPPVRLWHTELAIRERVYGRGANSTTYTESFNVTDVYRVLENSGFHKMLFLPTSCGEWYVMDLQTAMKAITACKNLQPILASRWVANEAQPITLREARRDEEERTLTRSEKKNDDASLNAVQNARTCLYHNTEEMIDALSTAFKLAGIRDAMVNVEAAEGQKNTYLAWTVCTKKDAKMVKSVLRVFLFVAGVEVVRTKVNKDGFVISTFKTNFASNGMIGGIENA